MQYDYLEALVKDLSLYKIKTEINMKNLRIWQTLMARLACYILASVCPNSFIREIG